MLEDVHKYQKEEIREAMEGEEMVTEVEVMRNQEETIELNVMPFKARTIRGV